MRIGRTLPPAAATLTLGDLWQGIRSLRGGRPVAALESEIAEHFGARHAALVSSGTAFGDGLLCLGGTVVRLGATLASGGIGSVLVNHGAGAGTFHYQLWYRNNPPFCTPSQFNLTNGIAILWP